MVSGGRRKRGNKKMAQAFEATPSVKGFEAMKLIKRIMTSQPDAEKTRRLQKCSSRIDSYKK